MNKIPLAIRKEIAARVWSAADTLNWLRLSDQEKSRHYETWLADPNVGGVLEQFLDQRNVRVYLKDSVIKPYSRERTKDMPPVLAAIDVTNITSFKKEWIKPHGRILSDLRCICWGPANDWKTIVLSVCERAYHFPRAIPYAAVFIGPLGKMAQASEQRFVATVARKLGLKKLVWDDVVQDLEAEPKTELGR